MDSLSLVCFFCGNCFGCLRSQIKIALKVVLNSCGSSLAALSSQRGVGLRGWSPSYLQFTIFVTWGQHNLMQAAVWFDHKGNHIAQEHVNGAPTFFFFFRYTQLNWLTHRLKILESTNILKNVFLIKNPYQKNVIYIGKIIYNYEFKI